MDIGRWYYAERWLYLHHLTFFAKIVKAMIRILWGGVIPYQADIGRGVKFAYQALGVVINKKAIIGNNCTIHQNVTIGGRDDPKNIPIIGDNVFLGAGSVLIGGIHIGNNVSIGANAVVLSDLPDNCTAVGIPAKPVSYR